MSSGGPPGTVTPGGPPGTGRRPVRSTVSEGDARNPEARSLDQGFTASAPGGVRQPSEFQPPSGSESYFGPAGDVWGSVVDWWFSHDIPTERFPSGGALMYGPQEAVRGLNFLKDALLPLMAGDVGLAGVGGFAPFDPLPIPGGKIIGEGVKGAKVGVRAARRVVGDLTDWVSGLRMADHIDEGAEMWHVTRSKDLVEKEGFREGVSEGFGFRAAAGPKGVSVTYSRETAESLAEQLDVAARAARGAATKDEVLDVLLRAVDDEVSIEDLVDDMARNGAEGMSDIDFGDTFDPFLDELSAEDLIRVFDADAFVFYEEVADALTRIEEARWSDLLASTDEVIEGRGLGWRVMALTADRANYAAIKSDQVAVLQVASSGEPLAGDVWGQELRFAADDLETVTAAGVARETVEAAGVDLEGAKAFLEWSRKNPRPRGLRGEPADPDTMPEAARRWIDEQTAGWWEDDLNEPIRDAWIDEATAQVNVGDSTLAWDDPLLDVERTSVGWERFREDVVEVETDRLGQQLDKSADEIAAARAWEEARDAAVVGDPEWGGFPVEETAAGGVARETGGALPSVLSQTHITGRRATAESLYEHINMQNGVLSIDPPGTTYGDLQKQGRTYFAFDPEAEVISLEEVRQLPDKYPEYFKRVTRKGTGSELYELIESTSPLKHAHPEGITRLDESVPLTVHADAPVHVPSEKPWTTLPPPNLGDDVADELAEKVMTTRNGMTTKLADLMSSNLEDAQEAASSVILRDFMDDPPTTEQVAAVQRYLRERTQEFLSPLPDEVTVYRFGNLDRPGVASLTAGGVPLSFTLNPRFNYRGQLPWSEFQEVAGERFVAYTVKKSDIELAMDMRAGKAIGEDELLIHPSNVRPVPAAGGVARETGEAAVRFSDDAVFEFTFPARLTERQVDDLSESIGWRTSELSRDGLRWENDTIHNVVYEDGDILEVVNPSREMLAYSLGTRMEALIDDALPEELQFGTPDSIRDIKNYISRLRTIAKKLGLTDDDLDL